VITCCTHSVVSTNAWSQASESADLSIEVSEVISNVYRLAEEDRCEEATSIRINWQIKSCQTIDEVKNVKTSLLSVLPKKVIVRTTVQVKRDGQSSFKETTFFATILNRDNTWIWDDELTKLYNRDSLADLDQYTKAIRDKTLSPSDVAQIISEPTLKKEKSAGNGKNDLEKSGEVDSGKTDLGSPSLVTKTNESLLSQCWSPDELRSRPNEKKIKTIPINDENRRPSIDVVRYSRSLPNPIMNSVRSVRTTKKVIALTFDFCEQLDEVTGYDGEIIDYLREESVAATLYMGGKWMKSHPERSMQLLADPLFELGNHAWTHGNFRKLSSEEMREQVDFTQTQFEIVKQSLKNRACAATDFEPIRTKKMATFRFPYGTCSSEALELVNGSRLAAIQWSLVSGDPSRSQTAERMSQDIIRRAKPGAIIVMHGNGRGWHTSEALRIIIPTLKQRGFEFVTVSALLREGEPVTESECYEVKPGDNARYDKLFGKGTGDK
jgi:peptidoglycan/xylan/chitin deacetylase (PgdA/CDA1 family)